MATQTRGKEARGLSSRQSVRSDRAQFLRLLKLVHANVNNRSESNLRRNQDLALAATGFQAFEHVGQFLDLDCVAHKQPGFDRPLIEHPK